MWENANQNNLEYEHESHNEFRWDIPGLARLSYVNIFQNTRTYFVVIKLKLNNLIFPVKTLWQALRQSYKK